MAFQWTQLSLRVKQIIVIALFVTALCLAWGMTQLSTAQAQMHHTIITPHTQIADGSSTDVCFK